MALRPVAGFWPVQFASSHIDLHLFRFVLGQCREVDPGTLHHDGAVLHFGLDRSMVPEAELRACEGRILQILARAASTHTAPGYVPEKAPTMFTMAKPRRGRPPSAGSGEY